MFRTRLFNGLSYQALTTLLGSRITYVLMIGLGLALSASFVVEDQDLRSAPATFRKVPCVVEASGVEVRGRNRYGFPTSFAPVITFTYAAADGREHTVSGYRLYEGGMSEVEAEEVADRYEPDEQAFCYYDPANPDRAVLTLAADGRGLGLLFLFSVLFLLGGAAGWAFLEFVVRRAPAPPGETLQGQNEAGSYAGAAAPR